MDADRRDRDRDGTGGAAGAAGGPAAAGMTGAARLLLVFRPGLQEADFDRIESAVAPLATELRWARRSGRLVLLLDTGPADAEVVARLSADPAVDHVLRNPSPEEVVRLVSRRDLLTVALATTGALAAACVAAPLVLLVRAPPGERSPRGDVRVASIDSIPIGGAQTRVVDGEDTILVRRGENDVVALSATCTHSGVCLVGWDGRRRQLVCPCHRGVFDLQGNVVSGPPPRPLQRREVVLRDGEVFLRRSPG